MRYFSLILLVIITACTQPDSFQLNRDKLAKEYFQEDADWYKDNVPFFECSDSAIEQVYYYRWKLYKAHLRKVPNGHVITEFINHVSWDRDPFCTINAAAQHHIYEGRWLRNPQYMDDYITYLYNGGNDRKYSESVADATYARYLVDGDTEFVVGHINNMIDVFNQWNDHWDSTKRMYYIAAMPDATEYTIASIDASGGKDGFAGGEAFRPTINSYQYGNALAIARIAAMRGDGAETAAMYSAKATALQLHVERDLWNESLQHFTDRFQVNNQYVKYWDFIRGRELAGFAPWYFNLPADTLKFTQAWQHLTDTSKLLGKYGYRTNEPAYEFYFHQFLWHEGKRGSQWNGPSWPYQTSMMLTGMANVLNNYRQTVIDNSDYLHALRLYTKQHYLPTGKINLVENYDPNLGEPIVHYYWSNHYNHSTYNNLVISGLCGIMPLASDSVWINPLVDESITYFALDNIRYHGHDLTVVYDRDGEKYKLGKGLTVFVDGKRVNLEQQEPGYKVAVGKSVLTKPERESENKALNISKAGYPIATASVNNVVDSVNQAFDGRAWYFTEITNHWTSEGSTSTTDWMALDFGKDVSLSRAKLSVVANARFELPDDFQFEYLQNEKWNPVTFKNKPLLKANTITELHFEPITTSQLRIVFNHKKNIAVGEVELYE
ncbi:MAG TPA: glycogen debranching protein [Cytophagales bacterium]|nr:glycogen debranching protein [Cytophagales bacterium]HRG08494.1 hypothetical protein [Cyclobacteriaceae bacterium]